MSAASCRHRYVSVRRQPSDPYGRLREALAAGESAFFVVHPDGNESVLGIGAVCEVRTEGPDRFEKAARAVEERLAACERREADTSGADESLLRFVGGFGFSDRAASATHWENFAPCWMFLPRELDVLDCGVEHSFRFDDGDEACVSAPERSPSCPPSIAAAGEDDWGGRVAAVLRRIEDGDLEKVVLSRSVRVSAPAGRDLVSIVEQLSRTRPSCHTFLVASGDSVFFGSTPELLLRLRDREFSTQAIAGTAPRGRTADEDGRLGDALLDSPKNRREQDAVVRGIAEAVAGSVADLSADPVPGLLRVPEAFHLHTRVRGTWTGDANALRAAGLLHPTPAVCGTPRAAAAEVIEAGEDRGWYSGAVGWSGRNGDGSFAVALRAGLLRDGEITLWAGAGIVAGSEAEAERAETDVKLRALGEVLGDDSGRDCDGDEFEVAS